MMLALIAVGVPVVHADCAAHTPQAVPSLIHTADEAIEEGDIAAFWEAHVELTTAFDCQTEILPSSLYAQHLMNLAIGAHYENRGSWELSLAAALRADPAVPRPDSRLSPLSAWKLPAQDNHEALRVPGAVVVYLDGRQAQWLSRQAETHFLQLDRDGEITATFLEGRSPAAWLETNLLPSSPPPVLSEPISSSNWVLSVGGAAAGVGLAAVAGTWLAHRSHTGEPYAGQSVVRAINLTGWGLTLSGSALVGVTLLR